MSGRGRLGLAAVVTPVLTPVLCAAGMRCDTDITLTPMLLFLHVESDAFILRSVERVVL